MEADLMRAAWWWIDRWRKSTAYTDMTLAEQGAYRNLLDECWLRGGVIPNDERILAKVCGDPFDWPKIRGKVLARFTLTAEGWRNETADEVIGQAEGHHERQKEKGRRRAETATRRPDGTFQPAGSQPDVQPDVQPEPHPESSLPSPSPSPSQTQSPKERIPARKPSWTREACDDWNERFGAGSAPGGRIGGGLRNLVKHQGWENVRPAWKRYLAEKDADFASAQDFASHFGDWQPGGKGGRGRKRTVSEKSREVLKNWRSD